MAKGKRKNQRQKPSRTAPQEDNWYFINSEGVSTAQERRAYRLDEFCRSSKPNSKDFATLFQTQDTKAIERQRRFHSTCPPRCLGRLIPSLPAEPPPPPTLLGEYKPQSLMNHQKKPSEELPDSERCRQEGLTGVGLRNSANVCWLNALLQPLTRPLAFRRAIYNLAPLDLPDVSAVGEIQRENGTEEKGSDPMDSTVSNTEEASELGSEAVMRSAGALARLTAQLWEGCNPVVDPQPLLEALGVRAAIQQDPHEFLNLFLSLLERPMGPVVREQWAARLRYRTTGSCGHHRLAAAEASFGISLPLSPHSDTPETDKEKPKGKGKGKESEATVTLEELLQRWRSAQPVEGEWTCPTCHTCHPAGEALHGLAVERLPPVLLVHLLRFSFDLRAGRKTKSHLAVDIPLRVSAAAVGHADDSSTFQLQAVIVHRGRSATGGHYVVYQRALSQDSQDWWLFDDQVVSAVDDIAAALAAEDSPSGKAKRSGGSSNEFVRSGNAYLLFYARQPSLSTDKAEEESSIGAAGTLPPSLAAMMAKERAAIVEAAETETARQSLRFDSLVAHATLCAEWLPRFAPSHSPPTVSSANEKVDQEVNEEEVNVEDMDIEEREGFWVSAEWLEKWLREPDCGAIDNQPLLCSHGKMDPEKVDKALFISVEGWQLLVNQYEGGPALPESSSRCVSCVARLCRTLTARKRLQRLPQKAPPAKDGQENSFWISWDWLKAWKARESVTDDFLTASLRCPHGLLDPQADGRVIPRDLWELLLLEFPAADPLPTSVSECSDCQEDLEAQAAEATEHRQVRQFQKRELAALCNTPEPSNGFLIPAEWLRQWRLFVDGEGEAPDFVDTTALLCVHSQLVVDPSPCFLGALDSTHWLEDVDAVPVSSATWTSLEQLYGCGPAVRVTTVARDNAETDIETDPPICLPCVRERQQQAYEKTTLVIELPDEAAEDNDAGFVAVQRKRPKSRRTQPTRRTRSQRHRTERVEVTGRQTLQSLKLELFQRLDIPPFAQALRWQGQLLENDDLTLIDCGLPQRAHLTLHQKPDSELGWEDVAPMEPEEGFQGSHLVGGVAEWACAQCTLHNPPSRSACAVCDAPKPS